MKINFYNSIPVSFSSVIDANRELRICNEKHLKKNFNNEEKKIYIENSSVEGNISTKKPVGIKQSKFTGDVNILNATINLIYGTEFNGNINSKGGDVFMTHGTSLEGDINTDSGNIDIQHTSVVYGNVSSKRGGINLLESEITGNAYSNGKTMELHRSDVGGNVIAGDNCNVIATHTNIAGTLVINPDNNNMFDCVSVKNLYIKTSTKVNERSRFELEQAMHNFKNRRTQFLSSSDRIYLKDGYIIEAQKQNGTLIIITPDAEVFENGININKESRFRNYIKYQKANSEAPNVESVYYSSKKHWQKISKRMDKITTLPMGLKVTDKIICEDDVYLVVPSNMGESTKVIGANNSESLNKKFNHK